MAISKTAQKNHEELFPGHQSTLTTTGTELIEMFNNFAFDEVISHSHLETKTRLVVILASLIAQQTLGEYKVMLGAALNVGVTPVEVKEIVYQAVPYVGIAKVFDFLRITNEVFKERGFKLPLPGQSTTTRDTLMEKGLEVQKQIIGDAMVEQLYASSPEDLIHIQHYLSGHCFGDYYTRRGIDIPTRELLTLSMLVSLGGCEPQVKGHAQANLHVDNDRTVLIDVITQLLPFIGYPRTLNAMKVINEITEMTE